MTTPHTELAIVDEPTNLDAINEDVVRARQTMPAVMGYGNALQPQTFRELTIIADYLAKSDAVPKAYQGKPHAIVVAGIAGTELGLSLMKALQGICVINGVPSLYGKTAHAMVTRHKDFEQIEEWFEGEPDGDVFEAHVVLHRTGRTAVHRTFSKTDALRIQTQHGSGTRGSLWEKPGPWKDGYKARMCQWRARGLAYADQFADALLGFGIVEEMIDVTPQRAPSAALPATSRTAALRETITQAAAPAQAGDPTDVIVPTTRAPEAAPPDAAQPEAASAERLGDFDAGGDAIEQPPDGAKRRITSETPAKIRGAVDFTTAKTLCNLAEQNGLSENDLEAIIFAHTGQYVLKKGASVTAIISDVRARRVA